LNSPTQRLDKFREELEQAPQTLHSIIAQKAQIQSAIEISEALAGLTFAVNDMADRAATGVYFDRHRAVDAACD
jgi:hypothetical protein